MSRCEFVWTRPVYDVESGRAAFEAERLAKLTDEQRVEQERKFALLEGQRCTEEHDPAPQCAHPDCTLNEYFRREYSGFHAFTVNGERFITSNGIPCWDCWKDDCGFPYSRSGAQ